MNKMTEKISAVMNDAELLQLIADHYQGESQLLTTGAEENLLKLAELRGNMTTEQGERWAQIKRDFLRNKAMGGSDSDVGARVVAQLNDLVEGIRALGGNLQREPQKQQDIPWNELLAGLERLGTLQPQVEVEVVAPPQPGVQTLLESVAGTLQNSFLPLMNAMDKKIEIDLRTHNRMGDMAQRLRELGQFLGAPQAPAEAGPEQK